ncbi:hypothetical protein GCM10028808_60720 [Spirosoma migulaei]
MIEPLTIPELFANSSINPQVVVCYLWQQNGYYNEAITGPHHASFLYLIEEADKVDFEVRWFLLGNAIRLTRVYRAIRQFIALHPDIGRLFTMLVLGDIRQTLLQNQWYELLPRYELACHRIQRHFNLPDRPIHSKIE